MKLSVIVPTFNESDTIIKTLEQVLKQKQVSEVIVVDDGSTDQTNSQFKNIKNPKLKIVVHEKNLGKGAAVRSGIEKASGDYLIIQDADLEYDPSQFEILTRHASPAKAIYGSRLMAKNDYAYLHTLLGNMFLTSTFNLLFGQNLTDSYTCYKLIPTKIARTLDLKSNGFEIEAEITAKLAEKGIKIIEVPIKYTPRGYKQGKKIKAIDALKGFLTYLQIRFS